jgi:hypothetical protein
VEPMSKKKDKKATEKKRAKAKHEKQKKRHLKLAKEKLKTESPLSFIQRPSFADMDPPDGFRAVSVSQALVEFGKPLMKDAGESPKALNEVFGIVNAIWNYEIMLKERPSEKLEGQKDGILNRMQALLGMRDDEANELFREMIERKQSLFPEEIQPEDPTVLFIKKELSHLIAPFHYGNMSYSTRPIPPDDHDLSVMEAIGRMDKYIFDGAEYDEWEDFYLSLEEDLRHCFEKWLNEKGSTGHSETFAFNMELFLNFIYRYMHDDLVILSSVPPAYLEEFLFDYLLRKLITEPHDYVTFPPALKYFYRFLYEKGYMPDPESIIQVIDALEPQFIEVLRERFG